MFAGIISRAEGDPWGSTGMTTQAWLSVPLQRVRIAELIATQPGIYLQPLIEGTPPLGGDPFPHVVSWRDQLYLEDGHTRVVRAALTGRTEIDARVLVIPDSCDRERV